MHFSDLKININNLYIYEDKKSQLRYVSLIDGKKGLVNIYWNSQLNKIIYYIKLRGKNFIINMEGC